MVPILFFPNNHQLLPIITVTTTTPTLHDYYTPSCTYELILRGGYTRLMCVQLLLLLVLLMRAKDACTAGRSTRQGCLEALIGS
jgi:hypothetical protein